LAPGHAARLRTSEYLDRRDAHQRFDAGGERLPQQASGRNHTGEPAGQRADDRIVNQLLKEGRRRYEENRRTARDPRQQLIGREHNGGIHRTPRGLGHANPPELAVHVMGLDG